MKSIILFVSFITVISTTTTSCVSNYVTSNTNYKYPTTNELLAYHSKTSKGPNSSFVNENKLVSNENILKEDLALIENSNIYAEKNFSNEAYNLISEAKTYLGTPYRYGGTTRNGIDCSSFVQHVFAALDIPLPRTSALQSQEGIYISKSDLQKGDLIFFAHTPKSRVSHVGIVESVSPTGEIFFIHASSSKGVTVSSLDMAYWKTRFRSGKRILNSDLEPQKLPIENENDDNLVKVSF